MVKSAHLEKDLPIDSLLQNIANEDNCMILSFVAPDNPIRTSPVNYQYTSIWVADLYNIEEAIEKAGENLPETLHLIIHTPGWEVYTTTKISKYLRTKFKSILAFVPYEAASWWTMMCLMADSIIMDSISNLTPIDPQVYYKWQYVWVWAYKKAINSLNKLFEKSTLAEVPPPYSSMCDKLDPVIKEEFDKKEMEWLLNAVSLLKWHVDPSKEFSIAYQLAIPQTTHNHVIDMNEATTIWLNVENWDKSDIYKVYKKRVKELCSIQDKSWHTIKSFLPDKKLKDAPTPKPKWWEATPE